MPLTPLTVKGHCLESHFQRIPKEGQKRQSEETVEWTRSCHRKKGAPGAWWRRSWNQGARVSLVGCGLSPRGAAWRLCVKFDFALLALRPPERSQPSLCSTPQYGQLRLWTGRAVHQASCISPRERLSLRPASRCLFPSSSGQREEGLALDPFPEP